MLRGGATTRIRRRGDAIAVRVPDLSALAEQVIAAVGQPAASSVRLQLGQWGPPRGWTGAPRLRGLRRVAVARDGDGAVVELAVGRPVDPSLLLAAALRCLRPHRPGLTPLVTLTPDLAASAAALAVGLVDVLDGSEPNPHLRRTDTLVVAGPGDHAEVRRARTVAIGAHEWLVDGQAHQVCVDPGVHRPLGRASVVDGAIGTALVSEDQLVVQADGLRVQAAGSLSSIQVAELGAVRGLVTAGRLPLPWRAQLEAIGVVLSEGEFPVDNLHWQAASVHARRHALRAYSPVAALDSWPSVSIVLVTHRDTHLDHALTQLAKINYPRLQVVVGLHGLRVDEQRFARLRELHPVAVHRIDGHLPFGSAVQSACDRAEGELVTKVDDDDHYHAEHVWDLVLARMTSGAELVGKALDWIHVESESVTAFRPVYPAESYATFVAGGTLLISRADLAEVGGWRPVPKSVDRGLIDAVKRSGGLVYRTHGLGYVYVRHGGAHTATVDDGHFLTKNEQQWPGLLEHEALGTVRHD